MPVYRIFSSEECGRFYTGDHHDLFRAKYIVVGTDFTFGCEKRGDVHMLAEYADQYDYELIVIEKERYHDRIISSTYVKEVVKEGDVGWQKLCLVIRLK